MLESLVLLSHLLHQVFLIQPIQSSPGQNCLKGARKGTVSHARGVSLRWELASFFDFEKWSLALCCSLRQTQFLFNT